MAERTIRDIIAGQDLLTAPPQITVAEAARQMRQRNVGAMLVVEGGKLAGIFTERDALGPELESFVYELLRQEQVSQILA